MAWHIVLSELILMELSISQVHRLTWKPDSAPQLFFSWSYSVILLVSEKNRMLLRNLPFQSRGRAGLAQMMVSSQKAIHRLPMTVR